MILTPEHVAEAQISSPSYERGLLTAIRKGYRARKASPNPYRQEVYQKAWQLGFDNKHEPIEAIEQHWLQMRKSDGEKRYGRAKDLRCSGTAATANEPGACPTFHPDDFHLDMFDWKLIPPGSQFWSYWNDDKYGMKAHGYRVSKTSDGFWIVCKEAIAQPAAAQPVHESLPTVGSETGTNVVTFPASRIMRRIVNGKPVERITGSDAA